MFGYDDETGTKSENFSNLMNAMLTLFTYVTVRKQFNILVKCRKRQNQI